MHRLFGRPKYHTVLPDDFYGGLPTEQAATSEPFEPQINQPQRGNCSSSESVSLDTRKENQDYQASDRAAEINILAQSDCGIDAAPGEKLVVAQPTLKSAPILSLDVQPSNYTLPKHPSALALPLAATSAPILTTTVTISPPLSPTSTLEVPFRSLFYDPQTGNISSADKSLIVSSSSSEETGVYENINSCDCKTSKNTQTISPNHRLPITMSVVPPFATAPVSIFPGAMAAATMISPSFLLSSFPSTSVLPTQTPLRKPGMVTAPLLPRSPRRVAKYYSPIRRKSSSSQAIYQEKKSLSFPTSSEDSNKTLSLSHVTGAAQCAPKLPLDMETMGLSENECRTEVLGIYSAYLQDLQSAKAVQELPKVSKSDLEVEINNSSEQNSPDPETPLVNPVESERLNAEGSIGTNVEEEEEDQNMRKRGNKEGKTAEKEKVGNALEIPEPHICIAEWGKVSRVCNLQDGETNDGENYTKDVEGSDLMKTQRISMSASANLSARIHDLEQEFGVNFSNVMEDATSNGSLDVLACPWTPQSKKETTPEAPIERKREEKESIYQLEWFNWRNKFSRKKTREQQSETVEGSWGSPPKDNEEKQEPITCKKEEGFVDKMSVSFQKSPVLLAESPVSSPASTRNSCYIPSPSPSCQGNVWQDADQHDDTFNTETLKEFPPEECLSSDAIGYSLVSWFESSGMEETVTSHRVFSNEKAYYTAPKCPLINDLSPNVWQQETEEKREDEEITYGHELFRNRDNKGSTGSREAAVSNSSTISSPVSVCSGNSILVSKTCPPNDSGNVLILNQFHSRLRGLQCAFSEMGLEDSLAKRPCEMADQDVAILDEDNDLIRYTTSALLHFDQKDFCCEDEQNAKPRQFTEKVETFPSSEQMKSHVISRFVQVPLSTSSSASSSCSLVSYSDTQSCSVTSPLSPPTTGALSAQALPKMALFIRDLEPEKSPLTRLAISSSCSFSSSSSAATPIEAPDDKLPNITCPAPIGGEVSSADVVGMSIKNPDKERSEVKEDYISSQRPKTTTLARSLNRVAKFAPAEIMQAESGSMLLRANSNCVGPDARKRDTTTGDKSPSKQAVDWKWKQELALSNRLNPGEMAILLGLDATKRNFK